MFFPQSREKNHEYMFKYGHPMLVSMSHLEINIGIYSDEFTTKLRSSAEANSFTFTHHDDNTKFTIHGSYAYLLKGFADMVANYCKTIDIACTIDLVSVERLHP